MIKLLVLFANESICILVLQPTQVAGHNNNNINNNNNNSNNNNNNNNKSSTIPEGTPG